MQPALKSLLYLALGGLALSVVSFMIWVFVNEGTRTGIVFGHVSGIATSSITIVNRDNEPTTVLVTSDTKIYRPGEGIWVDDLTVGQFVQVTGMLVDSDTIDAHSIRLMNSPRNKVNNDEPR